MTSATTPVGSALVGLMAPVTLTYYAQICGMGAR